MYYKTVQLVSQKKDYSGSLDSLVVEFVDNSNKENELSAISKKYSVESGVLDKAKFLSKKGKVLTVINAKRKPDIIKIFNVDINHSDFTPDYFRNLFAGLVSKFHDKQLKRIQINLAPYSTVESVFKNSEDYYQSVTEGILLGNYKFDNYKSEKDTLPKLLINIKPVEKVNIDKIIDKSEKLIQSVIFTRDLVNEPAITLTPQEFVKRTKNELTKHGVKIKVINRAELKKKGMNSILAVGDASDNPPFMMQLEYKSKIKPTKSIAFVGKGVTYDTGGLSIKPTDGMLEMKADMAGAGAVVGIIKAAALLKLPVNLTGVIPVVENMISGRSYKPGDVIKSYSGKTIEVKDTDAEGRIVLADALHYASKMKPDEIIDFATLTGAVVVALGLFTAGIFTKNDKISDALISSGLKVNEPVWRLPFGDEFNKLLKSDIADISNLGPRWGGAITAGKFLEHFVDKNIPYCHIDLAGPSIKHKYTNYTEKYDTGFGVRLMIDYLESKF